MAWWRAIYGLGWFPMEEGDDGIQLFRSRERALLPLGADFHVPRSLQRHLRRQPEQGGFRLGLNHAFPTVLDGCRDRSRTWISHGLAAVYRRLHAGGLAHSVEVWHGDTLAAGMLCIGIGACWIGESMFHRRPQAGNVLLVSLARALAQSGFQLFDVQISNPHLERFGCFTISDALFTPALALACSQPAILRLQGDAVSCEPWMAG
ncbi:MAG: leucyl/phenylalanyl-tRNA--protein transferase [Cyanobacteriota bacterium]|nr:leucyl/phenylalanyl-tRNA--protein transferase [Cyanobacteriota bacterium]